MKIGIDIGNKFAHVATRKPNGNLLAITDAFFTDQSVTPLHICMEQQAALIGIPAAIKEMEGSQLNHCKSFKQSLELETPALIDDNDNNWYATSLLTLILKKIKNDCESFSGEPVNGAVLTVPASFDSSQKKSFLIAASLADIPVLDIVSESIAAMHYFDQLQQVDNNGTFMICDLGDSALKLAIICKEEAQTSLLIEQSVPDLGMHQIKQILKTYILDLLSEQAKLDNIVGHFDLLQVDKLGDALLEDLASKNVYFLKKKIYINKRSISLIINKKDLESRLEGLVLQLAENCLICLQAAHLAAADLSALFLTGASAKLSLVPLIFAEQLQIKEEQIIIHSPTNANAFGAAILANAISLNQNNHNLPSEFRGFSSYNVGIKTMDSETKQEAIDIVIHHSLNLPYKSSRAYHFMNNEALPCILNIVISLDTEEIINTIGQIELNSIFDESPQQCVEVTFTNTLLGTIFVQAYSPQSGMHLEKEMTYLPEEEILVLEQRQLIERTLINDLLG